MLGPRGRGGRAEGRQDPAQHLPLGQGLAERLDRDPEALNAALEVRVRAVALDPRYSRGYSGIAYCHYRNAYFALVDDVEQTAAQCLDAAQRAVSLDDTDAFAHFVLSRALHLAGRVEEALLQARVAVQLNPNESLGHASLGTLLISAGRPDEGIARFLAGFGRYGIPFDAVYGPGLPSGEALPELLTADTVLDAMDRAAGGRVADAGAR